VKEQTPEICLTAVQQSGRTLRFVHHQTPKLCFYAYMQNEEAEEFIKIPHFMQLYKKELVSMYKEGIIAKAMHPSRPHMFASVLDQEEYKTMEFQEEK